MNPNKPRLIVAVNPLGVGDSEAADRFVEGLQAQFPDYTVTVLFGATAITVLPPAADEVTP